MPLTADAHKKNLEQKKKRIKKIKHDLKFLAHHYKEEPMMPWSLVSIGHLLLGFLPTL